MNYFGNAIETSNTSIYNPYFLPGIIIIFPYTKTNLQNLKAVLNWKHLTRPGLGSALARISPGIQVFKINNFEVIFPNIKDTLKSNPTQHITAKEGKR